MSHKIYLIVAADLKNGIGIGGKLPWHLKKDMDFFQKKTIQTDDWQKRNLVIMGHNTWESIPEKHRPLKGRKNVVLSRDKGLKLEGAEVAFSIEQALQLADERVETIFVIGGAKVFEQAMKLKKLNGIYFTRIKKEFKCDAFFPRISGFGQTEKLAEGEENGIKYEFLLHGKEKRKPPRR